MKAVIFISSAQKELQAERRALKDYVHGDPLLRRFFEVFLFEDLPASDRRADDAYLSEVDRCGIYVGLFGNEYGNEDISPTEREFDRATSKGKVRLIFVKGADDKGRHPKMQALIRKATDQLVRRRFQTSGELVRLLHESLVDHLDNHGVIQERPFEERPCPDGTLRDLHPEGVVAFVRRARVERRFPLTERAPMTDVLTHLRVLRDSRPTMASILLFGRNPQAFVPAAEVRCMHFHGTTVQRPAPSYQVFKGALFDQIDRAVDFVLSVLHRRVGTRAESAQAPVSYDVPPDVVREAIVNAVAHRDYASRASVQVSVFADRVEVANPGTLPAELTPESLRKPHASIPRNARLCEALFLTRYIEKFGTGTLMMIDQSRDAGLPAPTFEPHEAEFVTTLWRDWLTPEIVAALDLNERQSRAFAHIGMRRRITIGEYMDLVKCPRRTAGHDLGDLVSRGVLRRAGRGRGTHYDLDPECAKNAPNAPSRSAMRSTSHPARRTRKHPKGAKRE